MTTLSKRPGTFLTTYHQQWRRRAQAVSWVVLTISALAFTFRQPASAPPVKAPDWQQALPLGAEVSALALADDGDVYLAGTFEGTLRVGETTLSSTGATDIFVARFDAGNHAFSWARQAGGPGEDALKGLAVNAKQVYLAGYVGGSAGPAAVARFDTITLAARGATSLFVAKLEEQNGQAGFRWVQGMAGVRASEVQQLAVKSNNIYVAGSLDANDVYFGIDSYKEGKALPRDSTRYHHAMFVARLSDVGADVKDVAILINGFDKHHTFTGLVADAYSGVYLAGSFEKYPTTVAYLPTDKPGASKANRLEAKIQKLSDEGGKLQPIWDYTLGDSSETTVAALAVRESRLYAAGTFRKHTHFEDIRLATPTQAGYVVCLVSDVATAAPVWAVPLAGAALPSRATALALHDSAVYVAGSYNAPGQRAALGKPAKGAASQGGLFVSHLIDTDSGARMRWQQVATGNGRVRAAALVANAGPVYVAGSFSASAQFGRFGLAESKAPPRAATGFWAEVGPARGNGQRVEKAHN